METELPSPPVVLVLLVLAALLNTTKAIQLLLFASEQCKQFGEKQIVEFPGLYKLPASPPIKISLFQASKTASCKTVHSCYNKLSCFTKIKNVKNGSIF